MEKIYKFNGEEFDNYEEAEDEAIGYANDLFDEHLDDYFGKIKVGFFEYKTSDVLRRVDENLYAVMLSHFSDFYINQIEEIEVDDDCFEALEEVLESGENICADHSEKGKSEKNLNSSVDWEDYYSKIMGEVMIHSYRYYLEDLDKKESEGKRSFSKKLLKEDPPKFWFDFSERLDSDVKLLNNNYLEI